MHNPIHKRLSAASAGSRGNFSYTLFKLPISSAPFVLGSRLKSGKRYHESIKHSSPLNVSRKYAKSAVLESSKNILTTSELLLRMQSSR